MGRLRPAIACAADALHTRRLNGWGHLMAYREEAYDADEALPADDLAKTARKTWGGWVFVAELALGAAFTATTGRSVSTQAETLAGSGALIGMLAGIPIAVFLVWRVRLGKGWLAGSVLLLWWGTEFLMKLVGGTLNVGWGLVQLTCAFNLVLGVKACWQLRELRKEVVA